jgi:hypothetical protein
MKLKKTYPFAHWGALILMPLYLFIVVAHLFFSPKFQGDFNAGRNPVFKKNTELIYYLIRNDRSTFNENKQAKTFAKKSGFSTSSMICTNPLLSIGNFNKTYFQFFPDHHYSYLLNHIIRI